MSQTVFKEELHGSTTIRAYVRNTEQGWASYGLVSNDMGDSVEEKFVYPGQDVFQSKEEAGEAIWEELKKCVRSK